MFPPSAPANKSFLASGQDARADGGAPDGPPWRYRIYGEIVESARALPGLALAGFGRELPTVTVRWAPTPERLAAITVEGACFHAAPGEFLIWRDGVARFHVRSGMEITVDAAPTAAAEVVASMLLSAPWAARSLLAGALPLHASAVATPRGAVVFLGGASAGKSALAAACHARGFGVLADDLAVLRRAATGWEVTPGLPEVVLWPETGGTQRRRIDCREDAPIDALPLVRLYVLDWGVVGRPEPMAAAAVIPAVLDGVFRPGFVRGLGCGRPVFEQTVALARDVGVKRLTVESRGDPRGLVDRVMEDLAS